MYSQVPYTVDKANFESKNVTYFQHLIHFLENSKCTWSGHIYKYPDLPYKTVTRVTMHAMLIFC